MDIKELKRYIYDGNYVEQILESIECHHIKYHVSGEYWTFANATGDNNNAVTLYNNESLTCVNYTRQMIKSNRATDIFDLVSYTKELSFFDSLKFICDKIGISYYHNFDEDVPDSFKILKMIKEMKSGVEIEEEIPLKPVSEKIISYYKQYVNEIFYEDHIDYSTQKIFEIGFDCQTNRYTIPIRSEIGDLLGVKGRYFYRDVPTNENKYIYLEPCSKSKILYGLNKTINYIHSVGSIYIMEAEKSVMQLWSYGNRNSVSIGGKMISQYQINMIVRLGVKIIFCFDKDVKKEEYEIIAKKFPDAISIYYMYDEDDILDSHESPSDDPNKWLHLKRNNIYQIK